MIQERIKKTLDPRIVAGPDPHVGQKVQQVRGEGRARMTREMVVDLSNRQTLEQCFRPRVGEHGSMGRDQLGIICPSVEELDEGHPSGRRLIAGQQPFARVAAQQGRPTLAMQPHPHIRNATPTSRTPHSSSPG